MTSQKPPLQSVSLSGGWFTCKQGFKDEDRTLYECICKHCELEDVLTPQEMIEHEKLKHRENKQDAGESWCLFFGCMEGINIWDILTYLGQFAENSKNPVCKTKFANFF